MLGKLLKYEYKATARIFLIIYPVLLALSFMTKLSFTSLERFEFLNIPRIIISGTFFTMIIATMFITFILVIQRFYKNFLSEEGYLQLTLPASSTMQLLSKLIVSLSWFASSAIAIIISISILLPAEFYKELSILFTKESFIKFAISFKETVGCSMSLFFSLFFCMMIVSLIDCILHTYAAMMLGQLSNRNRVLMSFVYYIGINVVKQIISAFVLSGLVGILFQSAKEPIASFLTTGLPIFLLVIFSSIIYSVLFFCISNLILKKKLNLQ
ncbi:MAG: hypothetical protein RR322_01320 [Oscillospiraceae bacterium]